MTINRRGMSVNDIAERLCVAPGTVYRWVNGSAATPPYIDDALKAAATGLRMVAKDIACGYWKQLGLTPQHTAYWRKSGQVPGPARMATAWIIHKRVTGRDIA